MGRIGEYTLMWYVKLKKIGELQSRKTIHLFYFHNSTNHINAQWLKMWRRHLIILPSFIFNYAFNNDSDQKYGVDTSGKNTKDRNGRPSIYSSIEL